MDLDKLKGLIDLIGKWLFNLVIGVGSLIALFHKLIDGNQFIGIVITVTGAVSGYSMVKKLIEVKNGKGTANGK